ncbi:NAD(P)H-dependent oxidoreductase, partial [Vibrio mimicus]
MILGHPNTGSFCDALFNSYIKGAELRGANIRTIKLSELSFDPVLWKGYREIQELEPDLIKAQQDIQWAEHIAFIYPIWWGSIPSLMKGFIDIPGFAFKYRENSQLWDKLLSNRTAQL